MKTINGAQYSKEPFDGYNFRVKVKVWHDEGGYTLDVYTAETNRPKIREDLREASNPNVWHNVIHYATKEQDDKTAQLIDEFLNN